jgi:hypothetical protein
MLAGDERSVVPIEPCDDMSTRIEIYERCKLWPIQVVLPPNRTYVTLWGDAGGEDDRILCDRRGFLLFEDRACLGKWVQERRASCFAGRPGIPRLRAYLHERPWPSEKPATFNLPAVHRALGRFARRAPDARAAGRIVECLNLLWDAATGLENDRARALLEEPAPLGRLLDALTFHDSRRSTLPLRVRRLQPEALTADYAALLGLFVLNARVVGEARPNPEEHGPSGGGGAASRS